MSLKNASIIIFTLVLISCETSKTLISNKDLNRLSYQEVKGFYNENNTDNPKPDNFPMYPEGLKGLMNDVNGNIRYPESAVAKNIEGKVVLKYIIEKNGSIKEIVVEQSVTKDLDEEAIRVIKALKKWYPGFKDKKPIRVEFKQPFDFKLN